MYVCLHVYINKGDKSNNTNVYANYTISYNFSFISKDASRY